MDIDMHYYGTYALARAAGIGADVAKRIAIAAEFVDDSTDTQVLVNPQGARFRGEATAHHPADFAPNNDPDDQLQVWLPFHFLPGASGATQSLKLVCTKNGVLAQEMVKHHLQMSDSAFGVEMMGLTAHVYADTFAHYGFSGVSSRLNRVQFGSIDLKNGDPILPVVDRFFGKFGVQGGLLRNFRDVIAAGEGAVAEDTTGALGHGSVATFPDQPYLEWSYSYELPDLRAGAVKVERQNANDYMEAAEALHRMFMDFAGIQPKIKDEKGPLEFNTIASTIRAIVTLAAGRDGRIAAWTKALEDGKLTSSGPDKSVSVYDHQPWRNQTNKLMTLADPQDASSLPPYHFHQAASLHKHYVLRELLPKHGIYVV
jgi:hypothetical protein